MDSVITSIHDFTLDFSLPFPLSQTSPRYQGNQYFLSKPVVRNVHAADRLCRLVGGYLVQVDDAAEFHFLTNFLKTHATSLPVLLGATDEHKEGSWEFITSRRPALYLPWTSGEPSGGRGENCVYTSRNSTWRMFDDLCAGDSFVSFVCEV